ncbi:hypothetical protein JCM11251_002157 [Rhodosporidiobolus azoricus]
MAIDLSDPSIGSAYRDLRGAAPPIDWLRLGYKGSSSRIALLGTGNGGLEELRETVSPAEVQFGLLRLEDRVLLWDLIPPAVGGVKRARALVHSRALSGVFRGCSGALHSASPADFNISIVQARLNGSPSFHATPPTQFPTTPSYPASPNPASQYPRDQFTTSASNPPSPAVPQKPPSPLPNASSSATSTLPHRSRSSKEQTTPPAHQASTFSHHPTSHPTPSSAYSSSSLPNQQQNFSSGFPSHLSPTTTGGLGSFGAFDPSHSPTNGTAPHAFQPARKGSLTPSQHTREAAYSAAPSPAAITSTPANPSSEWRRQSHDRPTSPSIVFGRSATSPEPDGNGLFESAAAAMLAPLTPDPNSTVSEGAVDLAPRPHLTKALSSAASLKPSVWSVPVDVVPSEDEEDEEDREKEEEKEREKTRETQEKREAKVAAVAAAEAHVRAQREEAARLTRENREREAEDLARAEAEMAGREEQQRRREEERKEKEATEAAVKAEEERARAEEERKRLVEEERARETEEQLRREEEERIREEEERLRAEEEERTRHAEEEMRLMIERQKLEKRLREEEETRQREERRARELEERRRVLVEKRDKGEIMLEGELNVQGGNTMFWKRRYYHLTSSGLAMFKNQLETTQSLDTILMCDIAKLTDGSADALVPNSFKIITKEEEEYSFYTTGRREEMEMLLAGIRCAARMT